MKRRQNRRKERLIVDTNFEISFKNYEKLAALVNDRSKIVGRKRTGIAAKKQRKITKAIKHARHLGLLPFKSSI